MSDHVAVQHPDVEFVRPQSVPAHEADHAGENPPRLRPWSEVTIELGGRPRAGSVSACWQSDILLGTSPWSRLLTRLPASQSSSVPDSQDC